MNNKIDIKSVLDVGAHAGTFTFGCKQFYPDAYYYMIDGNHITEHYIGNSGIDYKIVYLSDSIKETVVYKLVHEGEFWKVDFELPKGEQILNNITDFVDDAFGDEINSAVDKGLELAKDSLINSLF